MNDKMIPVVLAGGQGTRFWPRSRIDHPKQFLSVSESGQSLLGATVERVQSIAHDGKVLIVANDKHRQLIDSHGLGSEVVFEPCGRNTAASNALAAAYLKKFHPGAVMLSLPSDHYFKNEDLFRQALANAAKQASGADVLVTIGVKPDAAHTGYGYIQRGEKINEAGFKVERFVEKPNSDKALQYFESGEFYWNMGVFVWRAEVFLEAVSQHMPSLYSAIIEIEKALGSSCQDQVLAEQFDQLESISVDYGIMEHVDNVVVVEAGEVGWSDVGAWDAWAEHFPDDSCGNMLHGNAVALDSKNTIVSSEKRLVAVLGCNDMVVIDSDDAILVCPRSRVQDVRKIVDHLKDKDRFELV